MFIITLNADQIVRYLTSRLSRLNPFQKAYDYLQTFNSPCRREDNYPLSNTILNIMCHKPMCLRTTKHHTFLPSQSEILNKLLQQVSLNKKNPLLVTTIG